MDRWNYLCRFGACFVCHFQKPLSCQSRYLSNRSSSWKGWRIKPLLSLNGVTYQTSPIVERGDPSVTMERGILPLVLRCHNGIGMNAWYAFDSSLKVVPPADHLHLTLIKEIHLVHIWFRVIYNSWLMGSFYLIMDMNGIEFTRLLVQLPWAELQEILQVLQDARIFCTQTLDRRLHANFLF